MTLQVPAKDLPDPWTSRLEPARAASALATLLHPAREEPSLGATSISATAPRDGVASSGALPTADRAPRLDRSDSAVVIYDLELLRAKLTQLKEAFPSTALHTAAIKANPIVPILAEIVAVGCGLEAASWEECELALAAGCPSASLVFDSPAKTRAELHRALAMGIHVNADNTAELDRIDDCLESLAEEAARRGNAADANAVPAAADATRHIGLRINPAVEDGRIATTSVGGLSSRFGVRLSDERDVILQAFERYRWLNGVHCHVGSQGVAIEQLVDAAVRILDLVKEIERRCGAGRIQRIDLGGGLPVAYRDSEHAVSIDAYVAALRERAPALLDAPRWTLVTEFGRALHAGCAVAFSRIEYVKEVAEQPTAVVHLGADMFVRRAYQPEHWYHAPFVTDPRGRLSRVGSDPRRWMLAGPLCFGGDVIDRDAQLSGARPEGWIGLRDVGAYTLGMWSRHCSRAMPMVIGIEESSPSASAPADPQGDHPRAPTLRVLKRRESVTDIVRFWGGQPREPLA